MERMALDTREPRESGSVCVVRKDKDVCVPRVKDREREVVLEKRGVGNVGN